jgi:hypothetical protein
MGGHKVVLKRHPQADALEDENALFSGGAKKNLFRVHKNFSARSLFSRRQGSRVHARWPLK